MKRQRERSLKLLPLDLYSLGRVLQLDLPLGREGLQESRENSMKIS
jgi:hypothetical protein